MTNVHGITVYGGTFPASIWRTFMLRALADTPPRDFSVSSEEVVTVKIDPLSGLLATKWCKGEPRRMLRQFVPTVTCPPPVPGAGDATPKPTESPSKEKEEKPPPEPEPTPAG